MMKFLEKVLKGLQVLLVVIGFGLMLANFGAANQLSSATIYREEDLLSLFLNAVQVLVLFGGALAIGALLKSFWK